MWAMAQNSIVLFFRGKLFAEPRKAFLMIFVGVLVTASLLVMIAKLDAPLWMAAPVATPCINGGCGSWIGNCYIGAVATRRVNRLSALLWTNAGQFGNKRLR